MIRTLRTLAAGVAAAGLVLAVASPADAKTRTFTDKRGDAMSALDVTKVKVTNKKRVVIVRATVPDFKKSQVGEVAVVITTKASGRPSYGLLKTRGAAGRWKATEFLNIKEEGGTLRCKGVRLRFGAHSITARAPQRCLDKNRKAVRVGVFELGRDLSGMGPKELENPGPTTPADVYPRLDSNKLSPWVGYR